MKSKPKKQKVNRQRVVQLSWNLHRAAVEFGSTEDTIKKGLVSNGVKLNGHESFTTRQIAAAIHGDIKAERLRGQRLDNDAKEAESKKDRGEWIERAKAEQYFWDRLHPISEALNRLVTDPELVVVEKVLREKLQKIKELTVKTSI